MLGEVTYFQRLRKNLIALTTKSSNKVHTHTPVFIDARQQLCREGHTALITWVLHRVRCQQATVVEPEHRP